MEAVWCWEAAFPTSPLSRSVRLEVSMCDVVHLWGIQHAPSCTWGCSLGPSEPTVLQRLTLLCIGGSLASKLYDNSVINAYDYCRALTRRAEGTDEDWQGMAVAAYPYTADALRGIELDGCLVPHALQA